MTMTEITPDTTLGEVVNLHPGLARELERRGLDYCCGGGRTLDEASRAAGLDPSVVAGELAAASVDLPAAPWIDLTVTELVDHIESTHHRFLWEELPRLSELVAKITAVHGVGHPELVDVGRIFAELRADFEPHLMKEERILFPMIRELAAAAEAPAFHCGSLRNPISVMLAEHDRTGEILERLRAATGGYVVPADGCASYRACYEGLAAIESDTHLHIHKENNVLFPAVVELEAGLGAAAS